MWHNISVLPIKEDGLMWIGLSALAAIAVGVVGAWLYRKEKIAGYTNSSNRLDTALSMLMVTNMRPQFVEYFVGVTNQLLSSGQTLPWINVGEGGN